ncbi:hypothetical protein [Burkholderia guangdongensis]|uniref:hypothetical protein n=1 Tax=Burkholderia guangdongensis TaxID=1792500 RepID=UPI0015CB747F|nr:hypothetical protein [Burkholderia guangdongensis]
MGAVATTVNIVLGVFNAYMLMRSRHVSLMVVPTIPLEGPARGDDPDTHQIRVQVVNLSQFTLYVSEVGFMYRNQNGEVLKFVAPAGSQFPIELKARDSIRFQPEPGDIMESVKHRFKCAYAQTACGRTRTGTSPSLQQQELNVYLSTDATSADLAKLRKRHQWERAVSYIRSTLW